MTISHNQDQSITLLMQAKIMGLKDHYYPNISINDVPQVFNPHYKPWSPKNAGLSTPIDPTTFQRGLGKFPYICNTRHDIRHAVSYLSSDMQNPTQLDEDFCRHLAAYLITTISIGLCFHTLAPNESLHLFLTSGSDAAFDVYRDSKSQLALVAKLGVFEEPSGAVLANSRKEKGVTSDSSTVAEAKAAHAGLKSLVVERNLLSDMGAPQEQPTIFYQDNKGFIDTVTKFGPCNESLRHVRRMLHVIQSHCQQKKPSVKIEYKLLPNNPPTFSQNSKPPFNTCEN